MIGADDEHELVRTPKLGRRAEAEDVDVVEVRRERPKRRLVRAAGIAGVALLASMRLASAQPSEAERLYTSGQKAYDDKRYDDAIAAWERSYALSKLPELVFDVAQAHRLRGQPGDCQSAVAKYREFIHVDPKSRFRAQAEGFLAELGSCGTPPVVTAPPPTTTTTTATIPTTTDTKVAPDGKGTVALVLAGAGALFVGTGVYFGTTASRLGDEVTEACAHGCNYPDIADKDAAGHRAATTQWVLYGVGAAALAASATLFYLSGKRHVASLAVVPHRDGALVAWGRAW